MALTRIFHTDSSRSAVQPYVETTGGGETVGETFLHLSLGKCSLERMRREGANESTKAMDWDVPAFKGMT
jgi:hypothetical protein